MQAFHSSDLPPSLDWFGDLLVESRPVVQWPNLQELDERIQLLDVILPKTPKRFSWLLTSTSYGKKDLHRCSGQTPPILPFEITAR